MADGISTRTQHDLLHQQQELERIEVKFDGSILQLRSEVEKLGTKMIAMFEQLMAKSETKGPFVSLKMTYKKMFSAFSGVCFTENKWSTENIFLVN